MAVGSPALATWSLTLTTLNRYWIRRRIKDLHKSYRAASTYFQVVLDSVEYLLAEGQQVPLRASQEDGWLSSLIVSPNNRKWWKGMQKRLESTRRGVTFSLVAQGSFAVIAWIFIIASAFVASLGSIPTALQVSAGSLWVWMVSTSTSLANRIKLRDSPLQIPVIGGWILVGSVSVLDIPAVILGHAPTRICAHWLTICSKSTLTRWERHCAATKLRDVCRLQRHREHSKVFRTFSKGSSNILDLYGHAKIVRTNESPPVPSQHYQTQSFSGV